ncbi:ATP-binding protein [Polaribacter sp. KT 15]|uniref:ATP-binding response regulator n=1 Tax=Polaribacter sp. KT 15 TaxID=1896175 RepID=UPI00090A78FE|nr:ATP-binding protein [Polaribacter sp. KT 15]SHN05391.1 Signal transduction histidine kinase [Polaribacter sp. KT 15]
MIPAKIEDVFIQITTNISGVILNIDAGKFAISEFRLNESIFDVCPFLEGTLDALEENTSFLLEGMVVNVDDQEFNVDLELFNTSKVVTVLIHNRTNVYKYVDQLNQNRNDIFFVKRELAEKNIELDRLRKIADKANEEKSRFLAMMSHEIRNPLNVILGYSEMISNESLNDNVIEYANLLSLSGKNLKVIVNDILDLSRIEAGKLDLVNSELNVHEIAKNAIDNYRFQNKNNNITLVLEVDENIPKVLIGDDVRVNQILSNLLSNALKFTEKGVISLKLNIDSEEENQVLLNFLIEDSGRGMTAEQASKIFNEYQQNNKDDNRVYGGAGLGLSIVKKLLLAMNGEISVKSKLNSGTLFKVKIPFSKPQQNQQSQNPEKFTGINLVGKRILVADDDVLNQSIVSHILKSENVVLTLVKDGFEALQLLKNNIFDIVLLDIHMPNITGEQLVQMSNEFASDNSKIPFLALTANTTEEDVLRYKSIGFKDVIGKPYTAKQLKEQVYKALI